MRPIDRGSWPKDINGNQITRSNYRSWRRDLIEAIGSYCSFCNMTLTDSPQVEHVIAQDIDSSRAYDWDNLVLACGACNRSKSNHPCPPNTHYLPQFHNTHFAFEVEVKAHPGSPSEMAAFVKWKGLPADQAMAENTIELCRLNEDTTRIFSQITDQRWKRRYQAIINASIWRNEWDSWGSGNEDGFARLLVTAAKSSGFWSVWFDKFHDVREIRRLLVVEFEGTNPAAFDCDYKPVHLNGAGI